MDATNNIATDLFYKIRSRFKGLKLGNEMGEITINPEDARFFDFDYMEGETPIGHVSISLAEQNSIKVYFSTGITESMDQGQKGNWYGFLKELRLFAKRRLMSFDTRDISKDNLDRRDYAFLTQHNQPKAQPNTIMTSVGESVMKESAMYGSKTVSYQKLMDTRLIVKHNQAVMDDYAPGARSRNISALFVENADGERFKYPFNHLAGARAMQRHVANGGRPYDAIGESIIQMSEEIGQLKNFSNYVTRNDLMTNETSGIVTKSTEALNSLREQLAKLSKQGYYESYKNSFHARQAVEIPEDVVEDFTNKFTVRNFKEDIKSVFPVLYRLMQENTLGYDDIVGMTGTREQVATEEVSTNTDPFDQFESWVMNLGETSSIQSQDPEEQSSAIQGLQALVSEAFPAGVDGSNAIESLRGIIDDPQLQQAIKEQAAQDPDLDVRGLVQEWLSTNAPETLEQLDFGDYADTAGENPAAPMAAPTEGLNEAASGDYEIDGEMATVEFIRGQDGTPQVTKIMVGSTDITEIEDLQAMADAIEPEDESPLQDVYLILSIDVDADYEPEERGSRERGTGLQLEPDYPASSEITGITAYGNGKKVNLYTDDLPPAIQDKVQEIADSLHSGDDDDYDIPDDYDDYNGNRGDRYEAINPKNPRDYERPAKDRKDAGQPPLRMQDVKAKDTEHKRNFNARVHGDDTPKRESINVQEVAEFIHSFYDRQSNTFPKGPEGVAVMVGKKFGEQAEQVARKMVERMAPQQTTSQNPELQELARIKQLSGM